MTDSRLHPARSALLLLAILAFGFGVPPLLAQGGNEPPPAAPAADAEEAQAIADGCAFLLVQVDALRVSGDADRVLTNLEVHWDDEAAPERLRGYASWVRDAAERFLQRLETRAELEQERRIGTWVRWGRHVLRVVIAALRAYFAGDIPDLVVTIGSIIGEELLGEDSVSRLIRELMEVAEDELIHLEDLLVRESRTAYAAAGMPVGRTLTPETLGELRSLAALPDPLQAVRAAEALCEATPECPLLELAAAQAALNAGEIEAGLTWAEQAVAHRWRGLRADPVAIMAALTTGSAAVQWRNHYLATYREHVTRPSTRGLEELALARTLAAQLPDEPEAALPLPREMLAQTLDLLEPVLAHLNRPERTPVPLDAVTACVETSPESLSARLWQLRFTRDPELFRERLDALLALNERPVTGTNQDGEEVTLAPAPRMPRLVPTLLQDHWFRWTGRSREEGLLHGLALTAEARSRYGVFTDTLSVTNTSAYTWTNVLALAWGPDGETALGRGVWESLARVPAGETVRLAAFASIRGNDWRDNRLCVVILCEQGAIAHTLSVPEDIETDTAIALGPGIDAEFTFPDTPLDGLSTGGPWVDGRLTAWALHTDDPARLWVLVRGRYLPMVADASLALPDGEPLDRRLVVTPRIEDGAQLLWVDLDEDTPAPVSLTLRLGADAELTVGGSLRGEGE